MSLRFTNIIFILHRLMDTEEYFATSIRLFNYPLIIKHVIISQNNSTVGTRNRPCDISSICKLIQDNFPIINKKLTENEESFEEYVAREIISLYHLFFILEELENILIRSVQQVSGRQ
jgi:hypothetical protein